MYLQRRLPAILKKIYLRNLKSLFGWGVLSQLPSMTTPILMLTGDGDYSPVEMKQTIVDAMQNAKLVVVKNSGDGTPIEKPNETNQAIEAFVCSYLAAERSC
jgi:3-oxoadipate enol-lactonase